MTDRSTRAFEVGDAGEQAVEELLRKRGWTVERGEPGGPDLIIEGSVTVEVKTANLSKRTHQGGSCWQFSLISHLDHQKPFDEDLLILRCLSDPPQHFIIPGCLIHYKLTKIDVTYENPQKYHGRWAEFREAWELGDLIIAGYLWIEHDPIES